MIETTFVSKEISEDNHLTNERTVLQYFLLNFFILSHQAIVVNLIHIIVFPALIIQHFVLTFCYVGGVRVAFLWYEALTLTP